MRRFALVFFSCLLFGCGGSTNGAADGGSDATSGDDGSNGGCPPFDHPPTVGTPCTVSATTQCKYGYANACNAPVFGCDENGNWQRVQIPPTPCPGTLPDSGDTCPMCFDPSMTCGYDAGCGDGGILSTRCKNNDTWEYFCAPPEGGTGDDGGPEGGDASGDASPADAGGSG